MSRGQNVPLVHCARCAELAIAYGEDAGAEEGRDVEVQRGERKESIEQRREVLREVWQAQEAGHRLGDGDEEVAEGEGHDGVRVRIRGRHGHVHGALFWTGWRLRRGPSLRAS